MSNNAWVTLDGGEIGRAQAVQSEACGLIPTVQMNPILLKPSGAQGSQVIVLGQSQGHCAAAEYYRHFDRLWQTVTEVLDGWHERCDVLHDGRSRQPGGAESSGPRPGEFAPLPPPGRPLGIRRRHRPRRHIRSARRRVGPALAGRPSARPGRHRESLPRRPGLVRESAALARAARTRLHGARHAAVRPRAATRGRRRPVAAPTELGEPGMSWPGSASRMCRI